MTRMRLIVNPAAGRGYAVRAAEHARRLLEGLGLGFDAVQTGAPGDGVRLAEEAVREGCSHVVAVGGDGTVHEVLNGLVRARAGGGPEGILGVIPAGSGNDFDYMFRARDGLEGACRRLAEGKTRLIDVGRIDDRYFANAVGIGFDAAVNIVSRKYRRLRGLLLYLLSALETIFVYYKAPTVCVNYDGTEVRGKMLLVSVGNGRRIGGGFMLTPSAEVDDGVFDLCLAREVSRLEILRLIPHVIRGTHVNKPPVTMVRARKIVVTSDGGLPSHVDGEIYTVDAHRLEMEILPRRLRVVCS